MNSDDEAADSVSPVEAADLSTTLSGAAADEDQDESNVPTLYEQFKDVIGIVAIPLDLAKNHDHYLHGAPKKS